jgi:hypothetical protein
VCKLALKILSPVLFSCLNSDTELDCLSLPEEPVQPAQPAAASLEEQNRQTQLMLNEYFEQACSIQQILGHQYEQKNKTREVEV